MGCTSCNGKGCWLCDPNDLSCGDPNCDYCIAGYTVDPSLKSALAGILEREAEKQRRRAEELARQEYARHVASLDKLPGAIRLFRTWRLTAGGHLQAMLTDHTWVAGENVSKASSDTNAAKDSGFHGFASLAELQKQEADWWKKSQSGEGRQGGTKSYVNANGVRIIEPFYDYWYVCGTMLGYGHAKLATKGARVQKAIPEYIIEPDGSDPNFGMLVVNAAEKYGMQIVSLAQAEELETGMVRYWKGRPIR